MKIQLRILTHGWGNNHLLLAPSLPTVGTYRDGKKESRSKNKELNLGEKILRNQTTAPLFHSMTRVWFYMCSQRNLCNSGLTAGPQEAAYWWKNLKPYYGELSQKGHSSQDSCWEPVIEPFNSTTIPHSLSSGKFALIGLLIICTHMFNTRSFDHTNSHRDSQQY